MKEPTQGYMGMLRDGIFSFLKMKFMIMKLSLSFSLTCNGQDEDILYKMLPML